MCLFIYPFHFVHDFIYGLTFGTHTNGWGIGFSLFFSSSSNSLFVPFCRRGSNWIAAHFNKALIDDALNYVCFFFLLLVLSAWIPSFHLWGGFFFCRMQPNTWKNKSSYFSHDKQVLIVAFTTKAWALIFSRQRNEKKKLKSKYSYYILMVITYNYE